MPPFRSTLESNLHSLNDRIQRACAACNRSGDDLKLMAVTKRFPIEVAASAVKAGLTLLGENRVQEGVDKIQCADFEARWELIGHLQSNKAHLAAEHFDGVQSVDSLKLAKRLNRFSREAGKLLPILLQVNTGKDPGKFGFSIEATEAALENVLELRAVKVEGFMTIAPLPASLDTAREAFDALRMLRDKLADRTGHSIPELSMGMSFDLEAAIEAGSTCIRVGSGLFGERPI